MMKELTDILSIYLIVGVVIYTTYKMTKSGIIDDAIKYFKREILKIK